MDHTFHTRHDFTPELGWAAFQLLAEMPGDGATLGGLEDAAQLLSSPLARRADLRKLLRSMEELGLVARGEERFALAPVGRALAASAGRYPAGFSAAVHCLYAWGWLWAGTDAPASPSWSYRQVCRAIRAAGPLGIEPDDVVLSVTSAGAGFGAERVSFSRSSVNGVSSWLKAQAPPLAETAAGRLRAPDALRPGITCVRYQVAALCRLGGGESSLVGEPAELLADALLAPPAEVRWVLETILGSSEEFQLQNSAKRVVYRGSPDPFLDWVVHGHTNT